MEAALNTVSTVLKADTTNLLTVVLFIILIGVVVCLFVKSGIIKYNGDKLQVGYSDNERRIIRLQIEYSKSELDIFFENLIKENSNDSDFLEWRCRLSKELIFDIVVEAIALNHITEDEFYVKGKLIRVWSELSKLNLSSKFNTEEFKGICYKEIEKIIRNLVKIREYYSRH